MTYKIVFKKSAEKEFKKLPSEVKTSILEIINFLGINPYSSHLNIKKLRGVAADLYRVRSGDYRIIYSVEKDILKIIIIKIGHRKVVYD